MRLKCFLGFFFANDNGNFNNTNAHKFAIAMNVYIVIHKRQLHKVTTYRCMR